MKIDKIIAFSYLLLGIAMGLVSNYFNENNLYFPVDFVLPFGIYLVSLFFLFRFAKNKKKTWLFYNSFITFVFIWIVVWILVYNL
jgi:hypothetical protein